MRKSRFTNENITRTLTSDNLLSGSGLFATVQADYSLSAAEYIKLKNSWVSLYVWALNIGFATFGYALSVLPKLEKGYSVSGLSALERGEWIALSVGVGAVVFFCIFGALMPSDRKEAMKSIKEHFKAAPKTRQPIRS